MTLKTLLCPVLMAAAMSLSAATYTTLAYENQRETNTLAYVETNLIATVSNNLAAAIAAAEPGDYANVSNKAVNALQSGGRADSLDIGSTSDHWHLSRGMNFRIKDGGARPTSVFYWPGYGDTSDLARLYEVAAVSNALDSAKFDKAGGEITGRVILKDSRLWIKDGGITFYSDYSSDNLWLHPDGCEINGVGFYWPDTNVTNALALHADIIAATNTLATTLRGEIAAIDVAPTVSNTVTQTYIRERLGVYLVYTNGMIKVYMQEN